VSPPSVAVPAEVEFAPIPAIRRVSDPIFDAPPRESPEPAAATVAAVTPPVETTAKEAEALFVAPRPDARARRGRGPTRNAPPARIPSALLAGWGVALLVAVVVVVAIARREELARAYPALAGVYAAIGLPMASPLHGAVPMGRSR
jgi:hypothetical protein